MSRYDILSDDHYINMNLNTEMELPQNRESVLHYFEQIQRQYPTMRNFYVRDRGDHVLEEERESGSYRWASIDMLRICSGHVNPPTIQDALQQHDCVLDLAPYALSVTSLDCESLNVMFGFDFTYRGNHNQLLVEALGVVPAFEHLSELPGATVIGHEPSFHIALDDECRVQCRLSFETRTSAYCVRTGNYPEEQLSVYVTARRFGGLEAGESYVTVMRHLAGTCQRLIDNHIADHVLRPLQEAIVIQ
ncbi:MAG: hypothetical protein ACQESR_06990 [Planctomycetota bacterium]